MTAKADVFTRNEQKIETVTPSLRALVRRAAKAALEYEKVTFVPEISVTFTDNEGIRELNAAHRNIDRPTDVLSFPLYEAGEIPEDEETVCLGDIVVSLERASEQAIEYGVKVFGITIHWVDASLDGGRIIAQRAFEYDGNDAEEVHRIGQRIEHKLYVETIKKLL